MTSPGLDVDPSIHQIRSMLKHLVALSAALTVGVLPTPASAGTTPSGAPEHSQADPWIGPHARDEARHLHDVLHLTPARSPILPRQPRASAAGAAVLASASEGPLRLTAAPLLRDGGTTAAALTLPGSKLTREVFGFAPYWNLWMNGSWNYSLLSTVAYFGLDLNGDGSINTTTSGWNGWTSQNLVNLINQAHASGDRVVVVIKTFDEASINQIVTTPGATQAAITNTINAIASKSLDGVNVDFEGYSSPSYPNIQSGFTNFMSQLSSQVHARWPSAEVSVDTYSGAASWDGGLFNIGALAPVVDAMFIMAYDMVFSNMSGQAGPNAPLTGWTYNDTTSVSQYLSKAPASKILLGVPYYGYKWSTTSMAPYADVTGGGMADTYAGVLDDFSCALQLTRSWDTTASSPWASWWSPSPGDPCGANYGSSRELYYDDASSLGAKYDLVNASNLRGTGMWALGYDGTSGDLWGALADKFVFPRSLGGSLTSGAGASSCATGNLDAFVLGGDGVPWRKTWGGTNWGAWTLVGGHVMSNPAAACQPGTTAIDLYTEGVDFALYHRLWNGSVWGSWENLGGSLTSGPGATSCASGTADVFVLGGDGVVWRKHFSGGSWSAWLKVGGNVMGNPAVVCEPGTSNIHLFVEGTDQFLYHRLWNGSSWGNWDNLGGSLSSSPATDSCTAGKADVFVLGGGGVMWRKTWSGTSWSAWTRIGGSWYADPGVVCQPGTTRIDLFERGPDFALWWTELAS